MLSANERAFRNLEVCFSGAASQENQNRGTKDITLKGFGKNCKVHKW